MVVNIPEMRDNAQAQFSSATELRVFLEPIVTTIVEQFVPDALESQIDVWTILGADAAWSGHNLKVFYEGEGELEGTKGAFINNVDFNESAFPFPNTPEVGENQTEPEPLGFIRAISARIWLSVLGNFAPNLNGGLANAVEEHSETFLNRPIYLNEQIRFWDGLRTTDPFIIIAFDILGSVLEEQPGVSALLSVTEFLASIGDFLSKWGVWILIGIALIAGAFIFMWLAQFIQNFQLTNLVRMQIIQKMAN